MTRLRVLHLLVQPVFVLDDGETLQPGPAAEAIQVTLGQLAGVADQIREQLPAFERQLLDGLAASETQEAQEREGIEEQDLVAD